MNKEDKIGCLSKICKKINVFVIPGHPVVNPVSIPTSIPAEATHFAVIDLCSAFFSIPTYLNSPFLFAFIYQGQHYTWTRLPQGCCESPTVFSQCLKWDLDSVTLQSALVLVQYVDNILVVSSSLEACQETHSIYCLPWSIKDTKRPKEAAILQARGWVSGSYSFRREMPTNWLQNLCCLINSTQTLES